jgi:hypothetical protein
MLLKSNTVPRDSRFRGNDSLLALALLVLRVLAQDTHGSLAPNDLAFDANLLYRGSDFHRLRPSLLYTVRDPASGQIVWGQFNRHLVSRQYLDEMHPHFT